MTFSSALMLLSVVNNNEIVFLLSCVSVVFYRFLTFLLAHEDTQVPRQFVYDTSSTDIFVYRHFVIFVYRHFVYNFIYYCIPAYRTYIHPTSVSENHYFHQFLLLLTIRFLFINPTSTDTMIIQHI